MNDLLITRSINWLLISRWRTVIFLLLSGALFPIAFAPFAIWPLAFVSIIFLLIILLSKTELSGFKIGFYWGVGCFSVGASWVYVSIHEFGFVPWYGASLLTLLFVCFLALYKGLFGYLCRLIITHSSKDWLILIAPACWLFCEFLQSTILNGFPWLLAGYSQISSPLAAIATWFGVAGVSWFVVALATLIALFVRASNKKVHGLIFIMFCLIIASISLSHKTKAPGQQVSRPHFLDVGLVQPNIPQEKKWDRRYFATIIDILNSETEQLWGADLIVWPEGAIPAYEHQVKDITYELTKNADISGSQLILGIPEYDSELEQSYVALKSYGAEQQNYRKQVLVPFGEYVPLEGWLRGLIKFLDLPMSRFTPAKSAQKPMMFENFSVIPAICYEIVYPHIIRDLSLKAAQRDVPQVIVTVSNDAWFGDSFGPYQHMQMARMRALELGIPLVRSTNDGITALVDANGHFIEQLPRYYQGSLRKKIAIDNINTIYRRWGSYGVIAILIFSCTVFGLSLWRNKQLKVQCNN